MVGIQYQSLLDFQDVCKPSLSSYYIYFQKLHSGDGWYSNLSYTESYFDLKSYFCENKTN